MMQEQVNKIKQSGKDMVNSFQELYNVDQNAIPNEIAETSPELSLYYCISEALAISNKCTQKSRELSLVITKLQEASMWASQMP